MTEPQLAAGRQAAGRYLRELLMRPGRYRQLWELHAERTRPGAINHLAVASVLAHHLWNAPRAGGSSDVLARQLKDTVGRALSGRVLSRSTLETFVAAFGFTPQEADRLWRLWRGTGRITVLAGPRAMRSGHAAAVAGVSGRAATRPSRCTTTCTSARTASLPGPARCRSSRPSRTAWTGFRTSTTRTRSPSSSARAAPGRPARSARSVTWSTRRTSRSPGASASARRTPSSTRRPTTTTGAPTSGGT